MLVRNETVSMKPLSPGSSQSVTQLSTVRSWEGIGSSLMAMERRVRRVVRMPNTASQRRLRGLINWRAKLIFVVVAIIPALDYVRCLIQPSDAFNGEMEC